MTQTDMRPRFPLAELLGVYAVVMGVTFAVTRLQAMPVLGDVVHLVVAAFFLVTALRLAQREPEGLRRHGIDLDGVLAPTDPDDARPPGPLGLYDLGRAIRAALPSAVRECGAALVVVAVVFPPFAVGFWLWNRPSHPFEWAPPDDLASLALAQLVVVGLPEEALFRGYFQTRLQDAWPTTVRIFRVSASPAALIGQAALFGVLHFVVDQDPRRLAVFFPGLLLGWMRAWRNGIGAAILVHALSNLYADLLARGWL